MHGRRANLAWRQALARAADAAWMSGDAEAALELALRAQALVAEPTSGRHATARTMSSSRSSSTWRLGRYAWDVGDREMSVRAFTHAGDRLDARVSPALRARALWGIGRGRIGEGRLQDAFDWPSPVPRRPDEGGAPAWEAEGWLLAGMARAWMGEDGITELRRGLDVALACGDPGSVGHGYLFLVDMLGLAGYRDESLALAEEGIQTADRLGIAETHGSDLRGDAALLLIDDGRWPEAASVLEPADPRAIPSLARALLAIRRGDLALADDELVATTIGPSIGGRGIRGGPLELARAELAWIRGDRVAAVREIESVPRSSTVWGLDFAAWRALWLARLGVDAGEGPRPRHPNDALDRALEAEIAAELAGGDVAAMGSGRGRLVSPGLSLPRGLGPTPPGRGRVHGPRPGNRPGLARRSDPDRRPPRSRTAPGPGGGPRPTVARRGSSDPPRLPRPVGAHLAGARSPGAARRGPDEPPDRRGAVPQREDRRDPRVADPRQAGRLDPRRSRGDRAPNGSAGRRRLTTEPAVRP